MKKLLLTAILGLSFTLNGFSQKTDSYTASNGMVYNVGDTITLGVGSDPDGNFKYIYSSITRTLFAALADEADYDIRLPEFFHGAPVRIKKIRTNQKETLFIFDTDGWGGFLIDIESAIKVCEVSYCHPNGYLTQEEYEKLVLMYRAVLSEDLSVEKFEQLRKELIGRPGEY